MTNVVHVRVQENLRPTYLASSGKVGECIVVDYTAALKWSLDCNVLLTEADKISELRLAYTF